MFDEHNNPVSPEEIPEERKEEIINKIADGIVKRRLAAPAIMFLESVKPMNYLGSQLMIFFEPIVLSIFNISQYREVAVILEERDSIEKVLEAIERIDAEEHRKRKEEKDEEKNKNKDKEKTEKHLKEDQ